MFHPKFATGNCALGFVSSRLGDLVELFLLDLDGEVVFDVGGVRTRPFGHSRGISTAGSFAAGKTFGLAVLIGNTDASGTAAVLESFHPKIELPLLAPPSTTRPLIRSSSIHRATIFNVSVRA
jgi:hypothetical protein